MTGDVGEDFNDWRRARKILRSLYGIPCPECERLRPKAHPTIMLPQQRCKIDGYRDPRTRLTSEQLAEVGWFEGGK